MVRKDGWILGWDSKSKLDVHISKDNWRLFATDFLFASTAPLNVVVEPMPDSVSDEELLRELNGDSVISLTIRHPIKAIEYPIGGKNTESITLPDSVERISSMAFFGRRKLSSIRLPPDFLYDDVKFYKIFHESTNPMKTFLKDMAYAEEPTLQGAVLYFIYWYNRDVMNGKDVSDIQKYIRPLERFIEKIDSRHTVENERKFKVLNLIFSIQSLLCEDISKNYALFRSSGGSSQVVKRWDSLDEGIKKRQIARCIYNMSLICSPFAKAYDEPEACNALMKHFVDPAKKMTILDYRKRIARHYLRRIQSYKTNRTYAREYLKDLEDEAKENFLNQLDEIVNLGFSTQAQILQAQLDEITNNTQKHSSSLRSGTGWFINPTHIVTCWHVVENTSEQTIVYENGAKAKAKIIAYDSGSDIAILSVSPQSSNDSFLTIQTRIARISDKVFAIGFPIPSLLGSSQKYTEGTISATKGIGNDSRFYQISTPLQPGNSGGALVNEAGEVIGITAAMLDSLSTAVATGTLSQNVNYAIKIRSLVALLDDNGIKYSTSSNRKISTSVDNLVDSVSKATVLIKAE